MLDKQKQNTFVSVMVSDKNKHFIEDHPINIPNKFDSNWPSDFRENN